jgi:hypothetical protein
MTLTFIPSKKAKAEASITLNTLLYDQSTVAERLTQVQGRSVEEYRNRATRYIMEFERAFAGNGVERTKYEAKF